MIVKFKGGIFGTGKSMFDCLQHYYDYPVMNEYSTLEPEQYQFPIITICQNSMHRKEYKL